MFRPLMRKIEESENYTLQTIATSQHVSDLHGNSYIEIEQDGFKLNDKVSLPTVVSHQPFALEAISQSLLELSKAVNKLHPHLVMLLGDDYYNFGIATACAVYEIPIAHLYGGEPRVNAVQESFLHAITKLSYFHFTATEFFRQRVIQLGEAPERVLNIGSLNIENIVNMDFTTKEQLCQQLNIDHTKKLVLLKFHPESNPERSGSEQLKTILHILLEQEDYQVVISKINAEANSQEVNHLIENFCIENFNRSASISSLSTKRYLSLLKCADFCIGNTSSGLLEAPFLNTPSINIGERQNGRAMAPSVFSCDNNEESIRNCIQQVISIQKHEFVQSFDTPYGEGKCTEKIMNFLDHNFLNQDVKAEVQTKKFFDR